MKMNKHFKNDQISKLIGRFEKMLKDDDLYYFDVAVYETIIQHYKDIKQYNKALKAANFALKQFSFSTELLLEKARVLVALDELADAIELTEYIAGLQPNNPEVMLLQESIYFILGDFRKSLEILHYLVNFIESKDEIHYRIAYTYQNIGKYDEAIREYKKAIQLNPELEHAVYELNYCLDLTGELKNHLSFYQNFTEEDPYSYLAWYNLGITYHKLQEYAHALQALEYATLIQEDFAAAYMEIGNIEMQLCRYSDAQKNFTSALVHGDITPHVLCYLAEAYEKMEDYCSAIINYKEAIRIDGLCDEAMYGLGKCLYKQGKWMEALHFYQKALQVNENNEEFWLAVADTEYKLGNIYNSLEAYTKSCNIYPENPELWLNWSLVYYEQGNYSQAIDIIKEGMEECPEEGMLYYRMSAYLLCEGKYPDAVEFLDQALIIDFDAHTCLFDFFKDLEIQKALYKIIEQFRQDER